MPRRYTHLRRSISLLISRFLQFCRRNTFLFGSIVPTAFHSWNYIVIFIIYIILLYFCFFYERKIREAGINLFPPISFHLNQVGVGLGVPLIPHSRYNLPFILPLVSRRLRLKDGYVLGDALLILIVRATDPSK